MNPNIEYEKFAQEVYQGLLTAEGIHTIDVKHNVKLLGRSGQKHQIDVYWEYELAEVKHRVAIECKNYNSPIPLGKVRDFYGVLSDLNNVSGIMVTKVGYQTGAKKYATYYGINLKELRTLKKGEGIIGEIEFNFDISIRHCLYLLDEEWVKANNINLAGYREFLISFTQDDEWTTTNHFPLTTIPNANILDENGSSIVTLVELENRLPSKVSKPAYIFSFENAYIDTRDMGRVKIREVKYAFKKKKETKVFALDARHFIKAILKDALNGEIKFIQSDLICLRKND